MESIVRDLASSFSRRRTLVLGVLAVLGGMTVATVPAFAYDETSSSPVNVDKAGLALRGYDPVAYFKSGKPTQGLPKFSARYEGATYHFASGKDRDAFKADPAKYAPAFGGYCAMGAVMNKKLDGDPNVWRIVDGHLYLNVGKPAQTKWLEDVPGNIQKATTNWPSIKDKAPKDL
jgi:YHS domain-containing protein